MIRTPLTRPIVAFVALVVSMGIGMAPPDDKKPSYPIEPAALAFAGKYSPEELSKDDVFVKALADLARSDLSPQAKADTFALMQAKIGWLFVGASRLFPSMGYAQTSAMVLSTYFGYQQKMPPDLPVGPLLDLARDARADHPLRASNALLLATIFNRPKAREAVIKAIDAEAIGKAKVPAIDLHNTAIAAALTADGKVVEKALGLLSVVESEESREDLLAMTGIYKNDDLRGMVEEYIRRSFPGRVDNAFWTGLMVLAHAGPVDHFRAFYKDLAELTKDPKDIDRLSKFWDSGFRDKLQSDDPAKSPLKIWDGFTATVETEGVWISHGESFRHWLSFR